jgi:hypothetical protein
MGLMMLFGSLFLGNRAVTPPSILQTPSAKTNKAAKPKTPQIPEKEKERTPTSGLHTPSSTR